MDCVIPGHAVKHFCSSIGCLSRIAKDIILEFDAVDGLTLTALSDSKAVFSSFHYEPAFFDRCMTPPLIRKRKRKDQHEDPSLSQLDGKWCVRVAVKSLAAVVRPRKDVFSLQLLTMGDLLAFEFQLQRPGGVVTRVTHKVGVAIANSTAAVAPMDNASELVVQPSVMLTMLEPLRRSVEMALLVNETHKLISSVSFAHDDMALGGSAEDSNANVNNSSLANTKQSSLKTETSIGFDELSEVYYVSVPDVDDDEAIPPPNDIREQVVLVFTIKEFKSMLQFCAQSHMDQELPVTIQFYWGGKPMVVKAKAPGFVAELVMATLDHKLLGNMKAGGGGG